MEASIEEKSKISKHISEDCVFCKIVRGEIPCHKIFEDDDFIAFLDIKPINKGHTLVVPKTHFKDLFDFPVILEEKFLNFLKKVSFAVKKAVGADGLNVAMNNGEAAGQVIFHQHTHIIPRFKDDGLKTWPDKEFSNEELVKIKAEIIKEL